METRFHGVAQEMICTGDVSLSLSANNYDDTTEKNGGWLSLKKQLSEDKIADHRLRSRVRSAARSLILNKRETQDALAFDTLWWARDIVECTGAESPQVGIPVSQVRKNNDRNTACSRGHDLQRSSEIAIWQIVIAKDKLKCLPLNQRSSICK